MAFNLLDNLLRPVKPKSGREGISKSEWLRLVRLALDSEPTGYLRFAACGLQRAQWFLRQKLNAIPPIAERRSGNG